MSIRNSIIFFLVLIFSLILSNQAYSRPLRIWVMNNEAGIGSPKFTEDEIREAIEKWRDEGIIIENSVSNLLTPAETKYPLASHIIGDNKFIKQLADYRRETGDKGEVSIEFIRWDDAYSRITSVLASNDAELSPDLAQVGLSWAMELADSGKLASLKSSAINDAFYRSPAVTVFKNEKDEILALPWFVEMRMLYYSKEAISDPSQISDWDSFLATCKNYTQKNKKPFIGFSIAINWNLLHNLAPWLWGAGGDIVKMSRLGPIEIPRVTLASPGSIAGLIYLKRLSESGCADFPNIPQEMIDRRFAEGQYAATITGPWIVKILGEDWKRRYSAAQPPAGPNGSHAFMGGSHLIIPAMSIERGNYERAVSLANWLTSTRSQLDFNVSSGFYPVNAEALEEFLRSQNDDLFARTVEGRLAYPTMLDWGKIVENDFIRNYVWHIWKDIAYAVPDETLIATVQNAAEDLQVKLYLSQAKRALPYSAAAISVLMAAVLVILFRSRLRHQKLRKLYELVSAELLSVNTERSILEGRRLLFERTKSRQSEEMSMLRTSIIALSERSEELKAKLSMLDTPKPGDEKRIGPFSIAWDGSLSIGGEQVQFDNNKQARKLIEHLMRNVLLGRLSLHCLWGYPLFGWKPQSIQTHPQRLFEIMAAKMNTGLRRFGAPPLIKRSGKGSFSWRLAWDAEHLILNSDIKKAFIEAELASEQLSEGSINEASLLALRALELDPKNLEALNVAKQILSLSELDQVLRSKLRSASAIGAKIIKKDLDDLNDGIRSVGSILSTGSLLKGVSGEDIEEEMVFMKHVNARLSGHLVTSGQTAGGLGKPFFYNEIVNNMLGIHKEILHLKSQGVSGESLWAQIAGSASFSRLITVPHLGSLVGNFYNESMQCKEDPRMVQLALISLLSKKESLDLINDAREVRGLMKNITKCVRSEIDLLSANLEYLATN